MNLNMFDLCIVNFSDIIDNIKNDDGRKVKIYL